MSSYTVSARYAKALLQLAQEQNKLATVAADISSIKKSIAGSSELKSFLKSPIIDIDKKAVVLDKLFTGKVDNLTANFINLLVKKGRESDLAEIATAFDDLYNQSLNIVKIKIISAVTMTQADEDALVAKIKSAEGIQNIVLEKVVDSSLVGGYIAQYNGKQIDASVSKSLRELATLVEDDSYVKKYY